MPIPAATKLLERIAADLSRGDVVFPTCFDITLKVRDMLRDPEIDLGKVSRILQAEPIISAKLLRMANSAALAPSSGNQVHDVSSAIMRLGLDAVKSAAFAMAIEQLAKSKHMSAYVELSSTIWRHSILVAALARRLAQHFQYRKVDDAFFAGLVHDIGAFYLLHYACEDAELARDRDAMLDLMIGWHDGIGHALLDALGQSSQELLTAVQDHESRDRLDSARDLSDLLRLANQIANRRVAWHDVDAADDIAGALLSPEEIDTLLEQGHADVAELRAAFGG